MPGCKLAIIVSVSAVFLYGCGDDTPTQTPTQSPPPVASVTVMPDSTDLHRGDTLRFVAILRDEAGKVLTGRKIAWRSSSPDVMSVDDDGLATAEAVGSATLKAHSEGATGTASVTVLMQLPASLALSPDRFSVVPGETMHFNVAVLGEGGDTLPDTLVSWSSEDTTVATVDAAGLITAVGLGFSTIMASFDDFADSSGVTVTTATRFSLVTAGAYHSCAIAASGVAFCWGANWGGSLGDGTTNSSETPVAVAGDLTWISVTAGTSHSCGVTSAGVAYCWGNNLWGQLGTGQTTELCNSQPCSRTPMPVEGGHTFRMVSSGQRHACAVTTDSEAYCWGRNDMYQLGNTTSQECRGNPCSTKPIHVLGKLDLELVSLGAKNKSQGLTTGARACWWGYDQTARVVETTPTLVPGNLTLISFDGGYSHDCGVTSEYLAYCWGRGGSGSLGNGSLEESEVPTPVVGGLAFSVISAGFEHTCGVTTDGSAYCWGLASHGQLGSDWPPEPVCNATWGDLPCNSTPVPVMGGLKFESISAGEAITCGITKLGVLYCWGSSKWLNLGYGVTPVLITIP